VLALWCIATALVAHANFGDSDMQNHFLKNLAMAGGFAYVAAWGAGSFSLDARLFGGHIGEAAGLLRRDLPPPSGPRGQIRRLSATKLAIHSPLRPYI